MALLKAVLKALDPPNGEVEFQYNPTKYQVQKALQWKQGDQKAADAPPLEFVQGQGRTVTMELFMDDYEDGKDVASRVEQLDKFTLVDAGNAKDASKARPPRVMFMWANKHSQFPAVIKTLNVTYTLFHEDGKPARATVSLTLQEWPDKPGGQNPTSMGSGGVRTHRVIAGETLDMIAYNELGAASRWKYIAELNNLDNPLAIQPGQHLVIAPLR
ncbi:MAG TPA: LysM peptidoglycan-binding domain-containing protein [Dehalococcoidia bacterium]|jgi:nucleoid-associated protein YgaU|nr:LysM peptidoglycan-binding domain-containing protein [Dehalococcoidia bacterium]